MTAIAAVLRFYKGGVSWTELWNMTLRQFGSLSEQVEVIAKMESGETVQHPSAVLHERLRRR